MKPYGIKKKDRGCCPGHDKYPKKSYKTTSRKARKKRNKPAKAKERRTNKTLAEAIKEGDDIVDQRSKEFYTMFD